jgi:hypothetical protein
LRSRRGGHAANPSMPSSRLPQCKKTLHSATAHAQAHTRAGADTRCPAQGTKASPSPPPLLKRPDGQSSRWTHTLTHKRGSRAHTRCTCSHRGTAMRSVGAADGTAANRQHSRERVRLSPLGCTRTWVCNSPPSLGRRGQARPHAHAQPAPAGLPALRPAPMRVLCPCLCWGCGAAHVPPTRHCRPTST